MSNFFGVAYDNTLPAAYATVSGADVTLTAGSEITVFTTGAIKTNFPGDYYPLIMGVMTVLLGGTAPSALVLAFKLGSGSDVATYTVEPGLLVNSAELVLPFFFVGANSGSAWNPTGSTINITAHATGQSATAKNVGSSAIVMLFQGPNI